MLFRSVAEAEGSTSNWGTGGFSFSYIYGLERKEAGLSTIKADTNLLATVTCGVFGDGITESDTDSVVVDHSTVEEEVGNSGVPRGSTLVCYIAFFSI